MERVFSYGTLQDSAIQNKLIGRTLSGTLDGIAGYKLSEIEIDKTIFWILIPNPYAFENIVGTVYEVSAEELNFFDNYEGVNYERSLKKLASGTDAWVYHAKKESDKWSDSFK
jgi:gamma-glutamylcyclotransferase (GGCT)/AIG2-like uncharacterized protein YtfP